MQELKNELTVYIPKLINGVRDLAKCYHSNNVENSIDLTEQVIEGIGWVSKAYSGLNLKNNDNINDLNLALNQINSSLAIKDHIAVGDIFEYEISAVLLEMYNNILEINFN
jgi:hypothetical protein